jgi:flagellar motor switch protein FliN/FliY
MSDDAVMDTPVDEPVFEAPPAAGTGLAYDELSSAGSGGVSDDDADLSLVFDLPVELAVEIGRTRMTIRETLAIAPGTLIQLDRLAGEPVDLLVNGHRIARGEVVAIDEEFGFRVTEIVSPQGDSES